MSPPDGKGRPVQAAQPENPTADHGTTPVTSGAPTWNIEPFRGPYQTDLGTITVCPLHPWDAPNLSLIDGAAPVCFTTGHTWDEGEARRAAR